MRPPVHPLVRAILGRSLEPGEFDERVRASLADAEHLDELVALIAWFRRRYPTVEARLAYVRRKVRALGRADR